MHRLSPDRITGLYLVWSLTWAGFTFRYPDWRVFTFTPWVLPKSKFQKIFVIYRWIIALFFTGYYISCLVRFTTSYFADVDSWCMLLRVIYFWWSVVVVTMTHFHHLRHHPILHKDVSKCKASHCGLDQDATRWYHRVQWCLAKVSGDLSIVALYWVLLTSNLSWTHGDNGVHIGIVVMFLVDEFIGYIPGRILLFYVDILAVAVFSHIHMLIHCDVLFCNATTSVLVDELDLHDSLIVSDKCSLVHSFGWPIVITFGAHVVGLFWTYFREFFFSRVVFRENRIHPQSIVAPQVNPLAEVSAEQSILSIQEELSTAMNPIPDQIPSTLLGQPSTEDDVNRDTTKAVSTAVDPGVVIAAEVNPLTVDVAVEVTPRNETSLDEYLPTPPMVDETPLDSISSSPVVKQQSAKELPSSEHSTGLRKRGLKNSSSPESSESKDDPSPKRKPLSPTVIHVKPLHELSPSTSPSLSDEPKPATCNPQESLISPETLEEPRKDHQQLTSAQEMHDISVEDIESIDVFAVETVNDPLDRRLTTTQASTEETPSGSDEKQEEATAAVKSSRVSSTFRKLKGLKQSKK